MNHPLFEDLLARSLAQLPEMETRVLDLQKGRSAAETATTSELSMKA